VPCLRPVSQQVGAKRRYGCVNAEVELIEPEPLAPGTFRPGSATAGDSLAALPGYTACAMM
jgi:hypothetical protein